MTEKPMPEPMTDEQVLAILPKDCRKTWERFMEGGGGYRRGDMLIWVLRDYAASLQREAELKERFKTNIEMDMVHKMNKTGRYRPIGFASKDMCDSVRDKEDLGEMP